MNIPCLHANHPLSRRGATGALLLLLAGLSWFAAAPASAQQCWVNDSINLNLGEVNPSGSPLTTDTLRITCSRNILQYVALRVCMNIPEGGPAQSMNPRWMSNSNGAQMAYDLFSDASGSSQIGPYGSGFPTYSTTFALSSWFVYEGSTQMQVWARARSGQRLPATHVYRSQLHAGQIRYAVNTSLIGLPVAAPSVAECMSSPRQVEFSTDVSATFANTCRIIAATDLDFGAVTSLPVNRDQTSAIQFQCPMGTAWRVGLDNGSHASGNVRRMAGPGGRYLHYELYRDPQRTLRWGNTPGTDTSQGSGTNANQSLIVHGRIPAQPTPVPGSYADTVTITLTY